MVAELYYFDGCPSYQRALDNLKQALRLERLSEEVAMIRVESPEDAQPKRFLGSPTIRLNGIDIEGADAERRGYAFACRLYVDNGVKAGSPSVGRIRQALRDVALRTKP